MSEDKKIIEEKMARLDELPVGSKEHEDLLHELLNSQYCRQKLEDAMLQGIRMYGLRGRKSTTVPKLKKCVKKPKKSVKIPVPNNKDILGMVLAVAAKNDSESNRYCDGETSSETYLSACAHQMAEITWIVTLNKSCESTLIEFWKRHKNFSEWGLVAPRVSGYDFLPETT